MSAAFFHPDLSALARSLVGQLRDHRTPVKHLEMLNMLARAAGHSNYQALKASAPQTFPGPSATFKLTAKLSADGPAMEIYKEGRPDGGSRDRRPETVERVYVLFDVDLNGLSSPGHLRLETSLRSDLLPTGQDPEQWFQPFVLPALMQHCRDHGEAISAVGRVALSLDAVVRRREQLACEADRMYRTELTVSPLVRDRLQSECGQVARAASAFERAMSVLDDALSGDDAPAEARRRAGQYRAAVGFLTEFLQAADDWILDAWNAEKLGWLKLYLSKIASDPGSATRHENELLRGSVLSLARPPRNWTQVVFPPPQLMDPPRYAASRANQS